MNSSVMPPQNPPAAQRRNWPWLLLVFAIIATYLALTGQLSPLLGKLPASFNLGIARSEPQWWEGTWRPSSDEIAVPWLQLVAGRNGVAGQFVTEAKAKGFHQSIAILGGEMRPPDALLFTTGMLPGNDTIPVRMPATTTFYLLIKRSEGTADLYRLANAPPGGELHLDRPDNTTSGPVIYYPADPELAHQRIAVLTKRPPSAPIPISVTTAKENRHE